MAEAAAASATDSLKPSVSEALNALSVKEARAFLKQCSGSDRWTDAMLESGKFEDDEDVYTKAEAGWEGFSTEDWLDAFRLHPPIGDISSLAKKYAHNEGWSSKEQSGVAGAGVEALQALSDENASYSARFGHIFIVFASGKSAAEMLAILRERTDNDAETEMKNCADAHKNIAAFRLANISKL
jgi:2-oxo-4-hydroxy-4-carboxy-5-ureidoimidazoline decarboxylase